MKKLTVLALLLAALFVLAGCEKDAESTDAGVDVDLTALSTTMLYSEVSNMNAEPESFLGKTVKIQGTYTYYHDDKTGNDYYSCMVTDVTACCSSGIEFVPTDDYVYPDDYPQQDEEICVVGTFDTYMEGTNRYCTLRNASISYPNAAKG